MFYCLILRALVHNIIVLVTVIVDGTIDNRVINHINVKTEAMFELLMFEAEVEKNLFLVSLIGAIIQGGDKRERRNV